MLTGCSVLLQAPTREVEDMTHMIFVADAAPAILRLYRCPQD